MPSIRSRPAWLFLIVPIAGLLAFWVWRHASPPRVWVRVETSPPGHNVWMSGRHVGPSPITLDVSGHIQADDPSRVGRPPYCVVNTIAGGSESVVELDTFLGRWKVGRLRFEAGRGKKQLVGFSGPAPSPRRIGFGSYEITLVIRMLP